jgi:PKD repeat protein
MKAFLNVAAASLISCLALTACTVHKTEAPSITGPSDLALSTRLEANPDTIGQDGGSQSSIRVFANGPDGKPLAGVTFRVDMAVDGVATDLFGALSARSIVSDSNGVARVIYTAPAADPTGNTGTCSNGLPGTCVTIIATPTATGFGTVQPQSVTIRLVPLGVIRPPAATPAPCMTLSQAAPSVNLSVQFTAGTRDAGGACSAATSDIVGFGWAFGDGGTASGRVVTHSFASPGAFVVTLTETSDRGVAASVTQTVNVGAATLPVAGFTVTPTAPSVSETVFFNASTSTAGAGHTIASYQWNFGDGGAATGLTATHAYAAAGRFTVTLTVTDEVGQSNTLAQTITVGNVAGGLFASFTFSPSNPKVGTTVNFNASASTGGVVRYDWDFGDGTTESRTTPTTTHTFGGVFTFVVRLTVVDSAGRTNSTTQNVTVTAATLSARNGTP